MHLVGDEERVNKKYCFVMKSRSGLWLGLRIVEEEDEERDR